MTWFEISFVYLLFVLYVDMYLFASKAVLGSVVLNQLIRKSLDRNQRDHVEFQNLSVTCRASDKLRKNELKWTLIALFLHQILCFTTCQNRLETILTSGQTLDFGENKGMRDINSNNMHLIWSPGVVKSYSDLVNVLPAKILDLR